MKGRQTMLSICLALKNRSRVRVEGRELRLFPNFVESVVRALAPGRPAELVVADWSSDDWPLDQWLQQAAGNLEVRVVPMDGAFSRGRGLNAAARAARGEMFFFTDADCLLCSALIDSGIRHIAEGKAFFPVLYSFDDPEHHGGWWRHSGFGNCFLPRARWEEVGGWPEYTRWGKEDVDFWEAVSAVIPVVREEVEGFYHQWHPEDILWKDRYGHRDTSQIAEIKQSRAALREIARIIPADQSLILVDEARFGVDQIEGRRAYPFLEHNGEYAGAPPDDATAVRELERLRAEGAAYVVFAWMAFWQWEYYAGLRDHIQSRYRLTFDSDSIQVWDMRSRAPRAACDALTESRS